jgi:hypothetical protein
MKTTRGAVVAALMVAVVAAGCTTYYRITDPASGKKYYTDEYKRTDAGVRFKDHVSTGRGHLAGVGSPGGVEGGVQEQHSEEVRDGVVIRR